MIERMNMEGSSGPSEFDEATIVSVIAKHAFSHPQRPAIVMTNGRVITYGGLWTQIETFGSAFRAHGFGATSRVAVMLPAPEAGLAIVATACHTAAVPLNPELTDTELDECFVSSRIDAMVTSIEIGAAVRDLAVRYGVHLFEASSTGLGQLRIISASGGSAKFDAVSPSSDAVALILNTSATTGRSDSCR
jgi:oxalate---CoA ligase